jgi:hypothetical protein
MNTTARLAPAVFIGPFLVTLATLGCGDEPQGRPAPPPDPAPREPAKPVETKRVSVGKNVTLEIQGDRRRVLVDANICLREGVLELLLCRKFTKEHEAILAADADAREIHAALLAAGAKPGAPVRFEPKYQPATGSRIKVFLQYDQKGKTVTVPAQLWVRHIRTGKDLEYDWVFAGSHLLRDPDDKDKPAVYLANGGDVICVSNFETAMLDLPVQSSKETAELLYEAHTERIPELDTKVTVILQPEAAASK